MQDAPKPTEEQSKKHLGIKVEDNVAPTEQPLRLMFYFENGITYYSIYRDGFTMWNLIFMSSFNSNMLPEDTFDKIVELAGIEIEQ